MIDAPSSVHPAIVRFPVVNHCIQVGGIPLSRLAKRVGRTPFFAYDRNVICQRVKFLRCHLPPEVRLHYAVKANPMPAVVQYLSGLVDGFDVASAMEMKVALDTTTPAKHISFAGPGKSDTDLEQAIAGKVIIELESEGEMRRVAALGAQQGIKPCVALRINPTFAVRGAGMRMGGGAQQFGIDAERIPGILAEIYDLGLDFTGFHIFAGSQNLQSDVLVAAFEQTFTLAANLAKYAQGPLKYLNIGGGFGIPYFSKEFAFDIEVVGSRPAPLGSAI